MFVFLWRVFNNTISFIITRKWTGRTRPNMFINSNSGTLNNFEFTNNFIFVVPFSYNIEVTIL